MTYTGKLRLHYNRSGAAPLVWSVRSDHWELNLSHVECMAPIKSVYEVKPVPDDEDGKPSAWFETYGILVVQNSTALIYPAPPPEPTP